MSESFSVSTSACVSEDRRSLLSAAVGMLLPAALPAGVAAGLSSGLSAPAWALEPKQSPPDLDIGGGQRLSALGGKVIYIDFWASWCGPCRQSFPWLNTMQKRYGEQGLVVIGINLDEKQKDADEFLAQVPASFKLMFDPTGSSAKRFGVTGMPTSVLVGADGKVVQVHSGFRPEQRVELEQRLVAALSARRP
ncbi:MAG: hypothetical protein RLZZ618_538 [Pseudomonadota bacterium]|jgi:thiol-disulfide isomerase/thioredoxin